MLQGTHIFVLHLFTSTILRFSIGHGGHAAHPKLSPLIGGACVDVLAQQADDVQIHLMCRVRLLPIFHGRESREKEMSQMEERCGNKPISENL